MSIESLAKKPSLGAISATGKVGTKVSIVAIQANEVRVDVYMSQEIQNTRCFQLIIHIPSQSFHDNNESKEIDIVVLPKPTSEYSRQKI